MTKRKEKTDDDGDIGHIIKLLSRVELEVGRVYIPADVRKVVSEYNSHIAMLIAEMEKQDWEHIENTPPLKIEQLRKELINNDRILKNNEDNYREQLQQGLYKHGLPVGTAWIDTLIEHLKLSIEEVQIKLESNFNPINPDFEFQTIPRWQEIQKILHEKNLKAMQTNLAEIEHNVEIVTQEIHAQSERIKARRIQIIEELEKLGVDISSIEQDTPPSYIN